MGIGLDLTTIITGIMVFFARVADVSVGTVKTISIMHGKTKVAFFLGFLEVSIWLVVISAVISKIYHKPILGVFYALGFSTGTAVGILIERKLAFGQVILRIFCLKKGRTMAREIRKMGFAVTTFEGKGKSGSVLQLYIICGRKDLKIILPVVKKIGPDSFYIAEQARVVSKIIRPTIQQPTGWRTVLKKK
jgi:uncharacterized protein YebE (UPF0316 family)